MKKTALLLAALLMTLFAASAGALEMTGLELETVMREWESSLFFSRMEALTGVAVNAHGVSDQEEYDKLIAGMLKGDVKTDALFKAELTRAQERALLDAGALVDIAPLLEENMPNLSALLAANPAWKDAITLEDGRIASLPLLNDSERQVCMWINEAWLTKLGLAMPTTIAELTDVLAAIKAGDPNGNYEQDEVAADLMGVWEMRWLLPYFGIVADDYNIAREDGKAVFAPELPAYREFVQLLRDWYAAGILPKTAFTGVHSATLYASSSENKKATWSGMFLSLTPYTHVPVEDMMAYRALLMPAQDEEIVWRDMLGGVWTGAFAVTSRCEDVAAALRWADALYAPEGMKLAYAGVEGEDYHINDQGYWVFDVDAYRTIETLRAEVLMYTGATMPGLVPNAFLRQVDSEQDRHVIGEHEKVHAVASQPTPAYALAADAQARAVQINAKLAKLVDEGIARFATGEVALNDANWNAWLAELEAAGSGELVEIMNAI